MSNTRAVSTVVGYSITLGITSLLLVGLLAAGGSTLDDQRERTVKSELEVIGEQVASDLETADRLVRASSSTPSTLRISRKLPDRAVNSPYVITVQTSGSDTFVLLSSTDPDVTVRVEVETKTPVDTGSTATGGQIAVTLDGPDLEVSDE